MSLVNTLMNGGMVGTSINPARYNHDNGALRIATESVEELHDIFMTTFYATEQAELGAVSEGVALEDSSYAAVYEASVKDAFVKVKEFFKKLWDKVKAWLHNVKRFLDAMFMSGKDFVKKYRNDINKANNIKDFSFKMYKYDDERLDSVNKDLDVEAGIAEILSDYQGIISGVNIAKAESVKKQYTEENMIKKAAAELGLKGSVTDRTEFSDAAFAIFRNGATGKDDKDDVDITEISSYASVLESSKALGSIDTMAKKIDNAYKKAIKFVDDSEREVNKRVAPSNATADEKKAFTSEKTNAAQVLSAVSSAISTEQSLANTYMGIWKTALKERDSVYKQLIVAGLSNSRKNSKKK